MTVVSEILDRLDGVHETSRGWMARCTGHEDRSPSLSIAEGHEGRVLLHCFAGCTPADVCTGLGIDVDDLTPSSVRWASTGRTTRPAAVSRPRKTPASPAPIDVILSALNAASVDWRIADRGPVSRATTTIINGVSVPAGPDVWLWRVERCPRCSAPNLWISAPPNE